MIFIGFRCLCHPCVAKKKMKVEDGPKDALRPPFSIDTTHKGYIRTDKNIN